MPNYSPLIFGIIIALAVGFSMVNGATDAANAIATVIGSRAMSARNAIMMAAVLNFVGALTGVKVAQTIGKGILAPEAITFHIVIAALAANIIWSLVALRYGLPTSETHGLVASLVGAGFATASSQGVIWSVFLRILIAVAVAPLLGFAAGFAAMTAIYWLFKRTPPARVRGIFGNLQIASAGFMAYSHGLDDGQMPIGIITMALVLFTGQTSLWDKIPLWVIVTAALSVSLGTALGGWQIIRTMGTKVTALQPVQGFAAETSAAVIITIAARIGIPVSTTQCISASIMGVGTTRRLSAVRWGVAREILIAWVLTFPICGLLGYLFTTLARLVL
ncbi:MAG: inorganic phosphate transporter [Dehalococcoidales bacterium]|nr:inorganic phosphate transporter [Dehalococcoidales bacterium]